MCNLPNSAKVQAIKIMCFSKLTFYFPNMSFPEYVLKDLENIIVEKLRSWFDLNSSTTRSFFFTPKQCGGLGIPQPRALYYAYRLSFVLSVLNSDDTAVRKRARDSLNLHMCKRKIPTAQPGETSFGGFSVSGDKLNKKTKTHWPKSYWVHIFEMCQREAISLKFRDDMYVFETIGDDGSDFIIESHEGFKLFYKQKCCSKSFNYWKELKSQGRYIRETQDIDFKLTMHIFNNHKIDDTIRNFCTKYRLQLLTCQSLLHVYYPQVHDKKCEMCGFHSETVSHVLNGCASFKLNYQNRHNRVVNCIFDKIQHTQNSNTVLKDKVLKPSMFNSSNESFNHPHTRPDITVINDEEMSVKITEIAIPYDCHISTCFQHKFDKYFPLSLEINQLGYHTEIIILLIGSMGSVHSKFVSGLRKININRCEAIFLAQYCSISAAIGSYKVWKKRCSFLDS